MKSIFDKAVFEEVIARVEKLTPTTSRLWGTMNVSQMLGHCAEGVKMGNGELNLKRSLPGYVFGRAMKSMYTNEKPFRHNIPTESNLLVKYDPKFDREKERFLALITRFHQKGEAGVTKHPHPFFGKLTPEEWGIGMYKHTDHHLRQFGV